VFQLQKKAIRLIFRSGCNRDKASLDIFWLRDESLGESDNLSAADVLAQKSSSFDSHRSGRPRARVYGYRPWPASRGSKTVKPPRTIPRNRRAGDGGSHVGAR
jgi:hypothetical protein